MFNQRIQFLGQSRRRQILLKNHSPRAHTFKGLSVLALMIVGGERERNKDRRLSCRCNLRRRRSSRPANEQIGPLELSGHVVNERPHIGAIKSSLGVCSLDHIEVWLTCLVRKGKPVFLGSEQRHCSDDCPVNSSRPLAPTKDQHI